MHRHCYVLWWVFLGAGLLGAELLRAELLEEVLLGVVLTKSGHCKPWTWDLGLDATSAT